MDVPPLAQVGNLIILSDSNIPREGYLSKDTPELESEESDKLAYLRDKAELVLIKWLAFYSKKNVVYLLD